MDITPQISVIVPVYNAAEHLECLLNSLFDQELGAIEIIAVNDGSTDASLSILEKWASIDSRLVVIDTPNGGPSKARNIAISQARGDWLCFADADDWVAPETFKYWQALAEQHDVDMLLGNAFSFGDDPAGQRDMLCTRQPWETCTSGEAWIIHAVENNEWPHYCWMQFIRRDFLIQNAIAFPEGVVHEDVLWTMELALKAKKIYFAPSPCYGYRRNPLSITNNTDANTISRRIRGYVFLIGQIAKTGRKTQKALRKALFLQANRECGHLLGLFRKKKLQDKAQERALAQEALREVPFGLLLCEARSAKEAWRVARTWLRLKRTAAIS
ncbi:glycosyltransferase [Chromobacterium phragmitis]|uniref:Glycosyl transferase n=1 Tax=Chromobacterium phragmitis TaxID=2202141 RepID=A0A344UKC8_9NEIS|nr:glycosyltransferase [Chromobacterium phragmitis]AXE35726.1 glycosyl transferase [Chromobacterium phragmitis]